MYWTGKGKSERWLNGTKWYGANYIYFGDETDSDDILSRTLSRTVIVLETFGDINKLFFDPLISEYFLGLL